MCQRQAALCTGLSCGRGALVYEHFTSDWSAADADFHSGPGGERDRFRPWGFQPGHLAQWAKLLLWLDARRPAAWLLPKARELFDAAWAEAWDSSEGRGGGMVYGFGPRPDSAGEMRLQWSNSDKYAWVQVRVLL